MNRITALIFKLAGKWWGLVAITLLNFVAFGILFGLEDNFKAITGAPVFDTQNNLTPATLQQQLPMYQGDALNAYLAFSAFDFIFPFVAALFLSVWWAFLLRINTWPIASTLLKWNMPLWVFVTTLFDWLENVSILAVIAGSPAPPAALINAVLLFKSLKLTALMLSSVATFALVVLAIGNGASRLYSRYRASQA